MTNGAEQIVQPFATETFDVDVTGMKDERTEKPTMHKSKGIRATFPLSALAANGFELRVVTDSREFMYEVDAKKRAPLNQR